MLAYFPRLGSTYRRPHCEFFPAAQQTGSLRTERKLRHKNQNQAKTVLTAKGGLPVVKISSIGQRCDYADY